MHRCNQCYRPSLLGLEYRVDFIEINQNVDNEVSMVNKLLCNEVKANQYQ